MSRITEIVLEGFKGQIRAYHLGEHTVLTGPNGLGKSAVLEGIRYALSGEVPTGRALDEVAKYFPPRGGSVTVRDETGAWIRRGIGRDHEKAKVSETVKEEGGAEWFANEALLDMRGFLALSANKRREFVLDLVGAGDAPSAAAIHDALARDYAREIGGPGADVSILDGREDDLPVEIRPLAASWLALWGVLSSYLVTGDTSASAIFQRLTNEAKERKLSSRRAATEAKAAIRELEAAAKGARAAAAEVERRRYEAEAAADAFGEARIQAARRKQADEALGTAYRERTELKERLEAVQAVIAGLKDPGPRPELETGEDPAVAGLKAEIHRECDRGIALERQRRELKEKAAELCSLREETQRAEKAVEDLRDEPVGRAVAIATEIRELGIPLSGLVGQLLGVVDEIAASWQTRHTVALERMVEAGGRLAELEAEYEALEKSAPTGSAVDAVRRRVDELKEKITRLEAEHRERFEKGKAALEAWETATRHAAERRAEADALTERYEAARTRHQALADEVKGISFPDLAVLEKAVQDAREALQAAEEAAGAVKAYEEAVARAKAEKIREAAWKAAEAACKRARETYVAEIVEPLQDEIGAVLAACGRQERVYLELENERKRPIFDLGWILDTSRRSLSALSGGEAVLFTAALALVIARRAGGRRVLLIEADPLDEENLIRLLHGLGGVPAGELDACLVATSTEAGAIGDWTFVEFSRDGSVREVAHAQEEVKDAERTPRALWRT